MGLHERAWGGSNLLIFGKTPLLPMRIEQSLAIHMPSNEAKLESFEVYEDALHFCKNSRNVGLIFLLENCGSNTPARVFNHFAELYHATGLPCFGILIHEGMETITGLNTITKNQRIFGYYCVDQLLNAKFVHSTISEIWQSSAQTFENMEINTDLQKKILSAATAKYSFDTISFETRVSMLISTNLNISWFELVALKWFPLISRARATFPDVITSNKTLLRFDELCSYEGPPKDAALNPTIPLVARIRALTEHLSSSRNNGTLEQELVRLNSNTRPGSPAILRHINNKHKRIISISEEEHRANKLRKAV